jgi:hypothetical protein
VSSFLSSSRGAEVVAAAFYPIGFVMAIVGRPQLSTQNTLYPVTLVLDEREHLLTTLHLWVVVWGANLFGALVFAVLVVHSGGVPADIVHHLTRLGGRHAHGGWFEKFGSGVAAGWLLAMVAWTIEASDHVIGQIVLIWTALVIWLEDSTIGSPAAYGGAPARDFRHAVERAERARYRAAFADRRCGEQQLIAGPLGFRELQPELTQLR